MAVPAFSESYRSGAVIAGKYRLLKRIGSGAMGAVWSAVNLSTNGQVALKLIERSDPELRQRLLREGRSCASIRHKNVVQVHDVGETDSEDPFLIMELLQGQTLAALLHERRRLPPDEVALLGRDIARGLSAAHEQGIVHRDLKPANIFLHEQPGEPGPVVKVLDFGVSKNATISDGLQTIAGNAVGSPMYMSPEQARAERDIDGRADVWSLGVVLYEMLTGERPFSGETTEVIFKITHGEIPRASRRLRRLDPKLDDVVAGCLTRDRSQRTESADVVAQQLEAHTNPAAREPLPSLMEVGLDDPLARSADPVSGNAAFSPGTGPTGLAAQSSPGFGQTSREQSSSRHPAVSRSGSRPLSGVGSQGGGLVDQDAATQPLSSRHLTPAGPESRPSAPTPSSRRTGSAEDEAAYGPRGTVRIDPVAVQAAIDAQKANRPRAGQGTMPMLQAPPLVAPSPTVATIPLQPPNLAPVAGTATATRKHALLWMSLIAVLLVIGLAVAAWFLLWRGHGDNEAPAITGTEAPVALSARTLGPPPVGSSSADIPAPPASGAPAASSIAPAVSGAPAASSAPTSSSRATPTPTTGPSVTGARTSTRPSATQTAAPKCKSKFGVGCK